MSLSSILLALQPAVQRLMAIAASVRWDMREEGVRFASVALMNYATGEGCPRMYLTLSILLLSFSAPNTIKEEGKKTVLVKNTFKK